MKKAQLPSLEHFLIADFQYIYEPSDDTFLLCDALENDRFDFVSCKPNIALEIGCGSGCVITFLTKMLKDESIHIQSIATDINPCAVLATERTAKANEV